MSSGGSIKRLQVNFSGRVQGVGFRYTVCRIAEPLGITGYVRNLFNGEVEVIAEGVEQELVDFLGLIRNSHLGRYIAGENLRWTAALGKHKQFRISYS